MLIIVFDYLFISEIILVIEFYVDGDEMCTFLFDAKKGERFLSQNFL